MLGKLALLPIKPAEAKQNGAVTATAHIAIRRNWAFIRIVYEEYRK
jgi:hypothetical protein